MELWYNTNLSGIFVVFNFTGGSKQTEYPDNNGFVVVPSNCADWTVYWNDTNTPVGAFLTFWGSG